MVNIVENWTELSGTIKSMEPDGSLTGFLRMILQIERTSPVKNFPDLVKARPNEEITVKIKKSEAEKLKLETGDNIKGIIRAAGLNNYFFKPDSIIILNQ